MAFGMFGQRPRFKTPEPYRTPGIGDGLLGMQPGNGMPQFDPAPDQMAPQQKSGLFNIIGAGTADKLSSIGDILQDVDGGDRFGENQRLRQQMAYQDQQYQRRQADERNTWLWQQQWERDHPKAPAPNDTERDWQFYEKVLSPQDFERWKVNRVVDPPRLQMLPDGRMVQIGGYQGGGGPASTPAPAGVTFTPIDNPAGLSSDQAAPILGGASQTKMISPAQAGHIRQSLGPNGQAAFEKWMRDNGITIGGN